MKKALFIFLINCCILTSAISQTIPPFVSANGLIGWWPFNGNADDDSMNGNEGQVHGAKLTTNRFDKPNKAYSFNGIYDYITVGNDKWMRGDIISIEKWSEYLQKILGKGGGGGEEDESPGSPWLRLRGGGHGSLPRPGY